MYSGGNNLKDRDKDSVFPIAERKIEFSEDEYVEEGYFGFDTKNVKPEYLDQLLLSNLAFLDDSISQITDCYPVVKYFSTENYTCLNRFVESITVAAISGTRVFFDDDFKPTNEEFDEELTAYITSPFGMSSRIFNFDLCRFLFKKPQLTVTSDGVLLFYTSTTIFATLDCTEGNIVGVEELAEAVEMPQIDKISSITASPEGYALIEFSTDVFIEQEDGEEVNQSIIGVLRVHLDLLSLNGVSIEIDKIPIQVPPIQS